MADLKLSNNAFAKLQAGITAIQTNVTVQAGQGQLFPYLDGSNYFYCTLVDSSATREVVKVTSHLAGSPDAFVVERGQDDTVGHAYSAGDIFELRLNAAVINDLSDRITEHVDFVGAEAHGLGTISTQDADDVNITGGTIEGATISNTTIENCSITLDPADTAVAGDVAPTVNAIANVYISSSPTPPTANTTTRGTLFLYYA
jgi:hypothetical protein